MKVIVVAPHASATFGGESILPLHYFSRLRKVGIEVLLVVHERTRDELSGLFGDACPDIYYVPDRWYHKLIYRCQKLLPPRIGTMSFGVLLGLATQFEQKKIVKRLIRTQQIDVVHEPIRVSPAWPSMMYGLGVPVIIGPMNGGMVFPQCFTHFQSSVEKYFYRIGRFFARFINQLIPGKRDAAALLVANQRTAKALPVAHPNVIELVENGVDLTLFDPQSSTPSTASADVFKLMYLGRLVDWKAVDILVDAMKGLSEKHIELHIVGDGDQRQMLEDLTIKYQLQDKVIFHGFLSQAECASLLGASDCLVLPSLYECGGAVVLEAMAMCKPVIASDWGGPADYLDSECGILIDVEHGREAMVMAFSGAIEYLLNHPDIAQDMGARGRKKVELLFDWDKKIETMIGIYEQVIDKARQGAE